MNYKQDEKWIGARIHCGARVLSNNTTNRQFISSQMRESRGRTVENRVKCRWCPIIKLRLSKKSREFSKHVRAIIGDCADSFYALLLPRFAKHKIQPERQIPRDFRRRAGEGGRGCREKDGDRSGLETADLKIAISALFNASLSSFVEPSDSGNGALDRLLRQIGRDLSSSRAPFGTSHRITLS